MISPASVSFLLFRQTFSYRSIWFTISPTSPSLDALSVVSASPGFQLTKHPIHNLSCFCLFPLCSTRCSAFLLAVSSNLLFTYLSRSCSPFLTLFPLSVNQPDVFSSSLRCVLRIEIVFTLAKKFLLPQKL